MLKIIHELNRGKIIAYPTESVFGLGCDPDNINTIKKLLHLKQRSWEKGFILIAENYHQLLPYIDEHKINNAEKQKILLSKDEPTTWVVPAKKKLSKYLTGKFTSIAIRITNSKLIRQLCYLYGKPLISTSANINGLMPSKTTQEVTKQFKNYHDLIILNGIIDGNPKTSKIIDVHTEYVYRK
uniref:Threonylcarbamoyl-AMP synthase n=1 Tax=Candidatus Aschnera chinzeii TaxID=1485666 RepID=A0AAT9G442_9ENTR|nr:MAG: L-threonylcarbamoyladenylate synthase [Candidatus Aschnera chinzeii]